MPLRVPFISARLLVIVVLPVVLFVCEHGESTQPNVVVVMVDDLGSIDTNRYGATDLQTPTLDRLCDKGVRLTQFYAAASVCSPSRAGLLTGRYPWTVGVPGNAGPPPSAELDRLGDDGSSGLSESAVTMAEVFAEAGYTTGHVGKWHLGHAPGSRPRDQGFRSTFGHLGGCIDNYSHFFYWEGPNRHDLWRDGLRVRHDGKYFLDLMLDEAIRIVDTTHDRPFFLYWAINAPHYPYQGDERWLANYHSLPSPRRQYAAFVSSMDERLGRFVGHLSRNDQLENTIILFQSDNGHSIEERAQFGGGNSGPYRGAKFSLFEGGIRLPAIISWPIALPRGAANDAVVHACDWLPTLCELADIPPPDSRLHGRSVVQQLALRAETDTEKTLYWKQGPKWAVRRGSWKLLHDPELPKIRIDEHTEGNYFLANLEEDVGEQSNLASFRPDIVRRLLGDREDMPKE